MTVAVDIDQKPPMQIPRSARPAIRTAKLGANATMVPDAIMRSVRASNTVRRSIPLVARDTRRLITTAKMPDTEIAWPACPAVR